jgi:hypothetical protein
MNRKRMHRALDAVLDDALGETRRFNTNGRRSNASILQAKKEALAYRDECRKAGIEMKVTVVWLPPYGLDPLPTYTVQKR